MGSKIFKICKYFLQFRDFPAVYFLLFYAMFQQSGCSLHDVKVRPDGLLQLDQVSSKLSNLSVPCSYWVLQSSNSFLYQETDRVQLLTQPPLQSAWHLLIFLASQTQQIYFQKNNLSSWEIILGSKEDYNLSFFPPNIIKSLVHIVVVLIWLDRKVYI